MSARFEERQRFRQTWLWALLLVGSLPAFALAVAAVVGEAGGLGPDSYPTLALVTLLVWGPLVVFHRAALVTEVRADGLYVRLFPLHRRARRVACEEITAAAVTSFSPVGDYRGVGIRYNPRVYRWGVAFDGPKAYVVAGGDGIRIERAEGRPLVIGSQRPAELLAALEGVCSGLDRPEGDRRPGRAGD